MRVDGREYVMRWFGVFPRTGRNDLFVAPVNRDTNKNVCPHIATKTWPRNRRFCSVRYVDFLFYISYVRLSLRKHTRVFAIMQGFPNNVHLRGRLP